MIHDGLAVYAFGSGEPILFMPGPHRHQRPGWRTADALIEGLTALGRQVITFDPPGSGQSTRPARLGMPEMHQCANQALGACGVFGPVDALGHSMGVLVGATVWLMLVFLYTAIVILEIKPAERSLFSTGLLSLLGVNLMILVTVACWQATFADTEPYEGLALGGKILIFLVTCFFFMLFFAPPRVLFLLRQPTIPAIASFLVQTGYFVWDSLNRVAWR